MSNLSPPFQIRRRLFQGLFCWAMEGGLISLYSFTRYGFLAGPTFLVNSFSSSRFLEKTLQGESKSVFSIAFSPDGTRLASGSRVDSTLKIWQVLR